MTLVQAAQVAAKQPAPNGPIKAQQSVDPGGVPGEQVTLDRSMPTAGPATACRMSDALNSLRFTK